MRVTNIELHNGVTLPVTQGSGTVFSVVLGTGLGIVFGNLALGIGVGIVIGASLEGARIAYSKELFSKRGESKKVK